MSRDGGANQDSLQAVLEAAIGNLDEHAQPEAVELALVKLRNESRRLNVVQQGILRDLAKKRLRTLGVATARTVDAALDGERGAAKGEDDPFGWAEPDPWPEPVEGAQLLDQMSEKITKHMVLPEGAADAMALWMVNTYTFDTFDVSPYLAFTSPMKRCGKTRALKILGALARRPLPTSNTSSAVIYRAIEQSRPTLLLDEAETFVLNNEEMRGILNSGHTRSPAYVMRCAGDDHTPTRFSTWCPKAFGLIGRLSSTLEDRSIVIEMRRKGPGETVATLPDSELELWARERRSRLVRWAQEHEGELSEVEPDRHPDLHDRANDNWRPLFAIAAVAGGDWPERARAAAAALQKASDAAGTDDTAQLLEDIRMIFDQGGLERMSSARLAEALGEMEDRPWAEWQGRNPITAPQLATLLKPFGVAPKKMRVRGFDKPVRGYELEWLAPIFAAYLPPKPEHPEQVEHLKELGPEWVEVDQDVGGTGIGTLFCEPIPVIVPDVPGVPATGETQERQRM